MFYFALSVLTVEELKKLLIILNFLPFSVLKGEGTYFSSILNWKEVLIHEKLLLQINAPYYGAKSDG